MANFERKVDVRITQADFAYLQQMTGGEPRKMSALVRGWIQEKIQQDRERIEQNTLIHLMALEQRKRLELLRPYYSASNPPVN